MVGNSPPKWFFLFENSIKSKVYSGEYNEFTGWNFSKALRDSQLVESDVSTFGLPSPFFLPAGSLYSVALTISLAASSGCDQLPLLSRLWRYRLVNWVLYGNLKINLVKKGGIRASTNRAVYKSKEIGVWGSFENSSWRGGGFHQDFPDYLCERGLCFVFTVS